MEQNQGEYERGLFFLCKRHVSSPVVGLPRSQVLFKLRSHCMLPEIKEILLFLQLNVALIRAVEIGNVLFTGNNQSQLRLTTGR